MGELPILTELIVSIVGGVITAVILSSFSRPSTTTQAPTSSQSITVERERRRPGAVSSFFRMLLAVCGGIALAMIGGRMLIQAGVLPRGLPTRLGLLIGGTILLWLVLPIGRSRR